MSPPPAAPPPHAPSTTAAAAEPKHGHTAWLLRLRIPRLLPAGLLAAVLHVHAAGYAAARFTNRPRPCEFPAEPTFPEKPVCPPTTLTREDAARLAWRCASGSEARLLTRRSCIALPAYSYAATAASSTSASSKSQHRGHWHPGLAPPCMRVQCMPGVHRLADCVA